ncbi:MAG: hypothetical protein HY902_13885 [Deltaproteobacteria bacterium]|nr:hypothetical protein [Deltaproteobacteria bacterium]
MFSLSEGAPPLGRPHAVAHTSPLGAAEMNALLARLPPLAQQADDAQPFAMRDKSLPPPRPGETVPVPFPPPEAVTRTGEAPVEPLRVVRFAPQGEVELAPRLSVTFNQPMVPLTSHEELAKLPVPVQFSPPLQGEWRWLGTQTVIFQPKERLPMATVFEARIAAGTKAQSGASLDADVVFRFSTPPPQVQQFAPDGDAVERQPLIVAEFDQAIDPAAVWPHVRVLAGKQTTAVRLVPRAELQGRPDFRWRLADLDHDGGERRWLALQPVAPLPFDSQVEVTFQAGMPSAEGPRTTAKDQRFSFKTYGSLRLIGSQCGWSDHCAPLMPFELEFSNDLDAKTFDPAWVAVQPALAGQRATVDGNRLTVTGMSRARTTYTVRVTANLMDRFGQVMGKPAAASFKVGPAEPMFSVQGGEFIVLDPAQKQPSVAVWTVNQPRLKVQLWRVDPSQWTAYREFAVAPDRKAPMPGTQVEDRTAVVANRPDEPVLTELSLLPALKNGLGHAVLHIETIPTKPGERPDSWEAWIAVSHVGLTAVSERSELRAWATELPTGKPLAGAAVELRDRRGTLVASQTSDSEGSVAFAQPEKLDGPAALWARYGGEVAILPENTSGHPSGSSWAKSNAGTSTHWHTTSDRGLYRPGETAKIKGWIRNVKFGPHGDVEPYTGPRELAWRLTDARGNEVGKGKQPVTNAGSFDLSLDLPKTIHLGHAYLHLTLPMGHNGTTMALQVQEFRRPEFDSTTQADPGPYFIGDHAIVTTAARYYAGGALASAPVHWLVTASAAHYAPPGHPDWTFGRELPWWLTWRDALDDAEQDDDTAAPPQSQRMAARTGADGQHSLRIDVQQGAPDQPWNLGVSATVQDVNRQTWSSGTTLLVHPSAAYVGVRLEQTFVTTGQEAEVGLLAVDVDGKPLAGRPVQLRWWRTEDEQVRGTWTQVKKDEGSCAWVSTAQPGRCSFVPKTGGMWTLQATVTDSKGRANLTETMLYVAGPSPLGRSEGAESEAVRLVPDRQEYTPGQVAKVLVIAPFPDGQAEITVARDGRLWRQRVAFKGSTATVQVPILEEHTPGLWVDAVVVGQKLRTGSNGKPDGKLPRQATYASGSVHLPVPPKLRTLQVKVAPQQAELEPGAKTAIDVEVLDAQGKPLADSEVTLVLVDDAVLALTGHRVGNPLGSFYPQRQSALMLTELRSWLQIAQLDAAGRLRGIPESLEAPGGVGGVGDMSLGVGVMGSGAGGGGASRKMYATMDDDGGSPGDKREREESKPRPAPPAAKAKSAGARPEEPEQPAIAVRKNFNPLAVFAPAVVTDAKGRARVPVTLPDNLTRYRAMAVAAHGAKSFGSGEALVTARLPLMLRPSAPRFANFGDQFELPVVLQNQTSQPLEVRLAARATVLQVGDGTGPLGLRVTVPANDRIEVRLPTKAPQAGTGRVQIGVMTGTFADAAEISLPVWTPATTEAFASYGVLDGDAQGNGSRAQSLATPRDAVRQYGGLDVTTSSTAQQGLTDALLYLVRYPFECSEQRASRMLAIAGLRDVLRAFATKDMPSEEAIVGSMATDLDWLAKTQNSNGSWGFWRRGEQGWPVTTLHVTHALVRAKQKGYGVPEPVLKRALEYCEHIARHFDSWYPAEVRRVLRAEALYVRLQAGQRDIPQARTLLAEFGGVEKTPLEALGWLWPVLVGDKGSARELEAIARHVGNRVEEQAGAAHFTVRYADGAHLLLASDRRADAILLDALMTAQPQSDLIPKLVTGLLAHRVRGKWGSTQENSWVLLALDRYFRTYEKVEPHFVARLWLGEQYAGAAKFEGRTTERQNVRIPMALLQDAPAGAPLLLAKEGPGRLYYRLGLDYAPKDTQLAPLDRGFVVERRYEAVDDPKDVVKNPDGSWTFAAGARVRVRLNMVASARRYHVALVDPLPAGLEIINGDLNGAQPAPKAGMARPSGGRWWWSRWYSHENLRDERAEAFASLLWDGDWEYTYLARATTPGRFVVPPAKAEEMYSPEVFGRSASAVAVVR